MKSLAIKMMFPAVAFVLASAGAVSTNHSSSESANAAVQGFKRTAPFNCQPQKICNNVGSILCVDGTDQMYAKPSSTSDCTALLTHKP
ncbi:hypothetical protein SAMN05444372_11065 [Flavobacterium micromati]|jgi:hypothetical protein|uniref:Uncharacterized protein n=1 Tax=Flavobacterium micromati TaxID=229205 RepID=A0A1M5MWS7_9FLAO|nr:DUF6520 family protein [Flavobacterium micromati]SHG81562.1 hypothetical protein SAMN05444372_11065 [Flavobacterium micromati]